jgi:hypothetical protein
MEFYISDDISFIEKIIGNVCYMIIKLNCLDLKVILKGIYLTKFMTLKKAGVNPAFYNYSIYLRYTYFF